VRREAQHQARFKADMEPSRELHEAEKVAGDAVEQKLLMESLGKPTPRSGRRENPGRRRRPNEAFTETLRAKFALRSTQTHATVGSGGDGKRNCGFCSRKCRCAVAGEAKKKVGQKK
jgi:hypothetical protein